MQIQMFDDLKPDRVHEIKKLKVYERKIKRYKTNWIYVQPKLKKRKHMFTYAYWYNIETKVMLVIPAEKQYFTMIGKLGINKGNDLFKEFGRASGGIGWGWIRQTKGWLSGRISGLRMKLKRRQRHEQWIPGMAQHEFDEEDTTDYEEKFGYKEDDDG